MNLAAFLGDSVPANFNKVPFGIGLNHFSPANFSLDVLRHGPDTRVLLHDYFGGGEFDLGTTNPRIRFSAGNCAILEAGNKLYRITV